jgi:hypothetical protein
MPTDRQLDANAARIRRGVALDVQKARATIEPWVDQAFPPRLRVAVTIALLQIAIDWQLDITDDDDFLLKRIHGIFADAKRRRTM